MSRRTALIALAIASIAIGTLLVAIDPANEAEGNPSIVDFEFAWSESGAEEIRVNWGDDGIDAARLSLWLDFAYLIAYGTFLVIAVGATRDLAAERGLRRIAAFGPVAAIAALATPLCDAVEDVWLLIALEGEGGDVAPLLGGVFATVKFAAFALVVAYLLAGLVARLRGGRRAESV